MILYRTIRVNKKIPHLFFIFDMGLTAKIIASRIPYMVLYLSVHTIQWFS